MAAAPKTLLAETATLSVMAGAAQVQRRAGNVIRVRTGETQAVVGDASNAFLVAPNSHIDFECDETNQFVKVCNLIAGALHSVFEPAFGRERVVKTQHSTIGIRGTAHYVALQEAENRTYSCCCYGAIELVNTASGARESQQTRYHDARIITASGAIEAAPYSAPLNHYDDTLLALEKQLGRQPRWHLPDGKMQFRTPGGLIID